MQGDKNLSVESLLSEADLSPIPSPDYDAPSPEPDDQEMQLKLPDEDQTGDSTPPLPPMGSERTQENNMSISEYLTQLATGVRFKVFGLLILLIFFEFSGFSQNIRNFGIFKPL